MTDLYLIAHKVRGEPAFDIAQKMYMEEFDEDWWIIPTSGHRAYPYWITELSKLGYVFQPDGSVPDLIAAMPPDTPDHYEVYAEPKAEKRNIYDLMIKAGLRKPLERRI